MARRHTEMRPDDLGFLYVDGHARAYFGTRQVQKMHIARMKHAGPGTEESWVTDGTIELPVTRGKRKGEVLTLRQVTRRDKGKQVHILSTSGKDELPAAAVAYRMTGRWREENWFGYGRAHFALDALDSYAVAPDDPSRKVPNPAKKTAAAAVKAAKKTLTDAEAARQRKLDKLRSPHPARKP